MIFSLEIRRETGLWTMDCKCEVTPQLAGRHMFWLVVYIYDMMIGDLW